MIKKASIFVWSIILGLTVLVGIVEAVEKFAYIDLSRVFNEYDKTKNYDKILEDKENVYTTERDKKVEEIKQLQEKMNLMTDKEKETKKADLETKVKAVQDFDREKQMDLRKEFNEKRAEIMKDIDAVIRDYAEKEGYTLVFNEAGVLYNAKNLDITDKILDILNKPTKK